MESTLDRRGQLISLFAGGVAGTVGSVITNPIEVRFPSLQPLECERYCPLRAFTTWGANDMLEKLHHNVYNHSLAQVVKTQLQSSRVGRRELSGAAVNPFKIAREVFAEERIPGFFRGLSPTLVGIIPARASYFWAYATSKAFLQPRIGDGAPTHILAALAAGVTGNTITAPIWMVKTRLQLLADSGAGQVAYKSYRDAIRLILSEEGIGGFYKGLSASYWGCSEGCIQFVVYERLKKRLEARHDDISARRAAYFGAAAFSKLVATVTTYPHEVVRTRLREQAVNGVFKYTGMWQALRLIAKEEGRHGLYAGMGTHVARVVPNTAIMFLTFEVSGWTSR
ncbi:unnamed protein product [Phaeothamnion confervicola]